MAVNTAYYKNALTGGATNALDGINGTTLSDNDFAFALVSDALYVYRLNATSGAAENPPSVIAPDNNAGTKRWILQGVYGAAASGVNADITSMTGLTTLSRTLSGSSEKNLTIDTVFPTIASNATFYNKICEFRGYKVPISAGVTDSGYRVGLGIEGYVYDSNFAGTLNSQFGIRSRVGIETANSAAVINNSYALYLEHLDMAGTTTNKYGVYQIGAGTKNYFAGNVGIGTTAPGNPLAVNRSADGIIVDFESGDAVQGNVSISGTTTSYNAFVGSHYTQLKDGQEELPVGAVVVSTGEIIKCGTIIIEKEEVKTEVSIKDAFEDVEIQENGEIVGEEFDGYELKDEKVVEIKKPVYEKITKLKRQLKPNHTFDSVTGKIYKTETIESVITPDVSGKEYFPYVDTTNVAGDKRVYGVWFGKMSDDAKGMSFGDDNKPVYLIAQVGLFKIRVTDTNGDIEIGDFLETSTRPMEAQKQISKQKEAGTIAKAVVNVDWNEVNVDSDLGYKWRLIPCTF